ncbi:hypothetical protein AD998_09995 [bacterium 336/3]|nr:hypothetical protein AD998_09995 [bacterium 336/3]
MKKLLLLLLTLFCHILYSQNLKDSLGRKQGRWIEKIKGKKVESHYKDGLLHGKQTVFQKMKDVNEESYFKNGVLDSISREYFVSSKEVIQEISFKNGLLHGYFRMYLKGIVHTEVLYENGTPNSNFIYYDSKGFVSFKYLLHPSKLFFYVDEIQNEGSIILRCFTYQDPLYFTGKVVRIYGIETINLFSKDIVKWMKIKKTFRQRRKMAEKLYNFKVTCK